MEVNHQNSIAGKLDCTIGQWVDIKLLVNIETLKPLFEHFWLNQVSVTTAVKPILNVRKILSCLVINYYSRLTLFKEMTLSFFFIS